MGKALDRLYKMQYCHRVKEEAVVRKNERRNKIRRRVLDSLLKGK